ncbi:PerC family transcriptional regulator [Escherichia coli]|nr:PerC family transcriptional regulator [Escherichia coli]
MVHDRIAEELESKGFYRRAAARWAEVMMLVETNRERERVAMRRAECYGKAQRPPEPPEENYADLRKAVNRTYAEMGIGGRCKKSGVATRNKHRAGTVG